MKRTYIKPESELIESTYEAVLAAFSMDVSSDGDVDNPIQVQSKGASFLLEDDDCDSDNI